MFCCRLTFTFTRTQARQITTVYVSLLLFSVCVCRSWVLSKLNKQSLKTRTDRRTPYTVHRASERAQASRQRHDKRMEKYVMKQKNSLQLAIATNRGEEARANILKSCCCYCAVSLSALLTVRSLSHSLSPIRSSVGTCWLMMWKWFLVLCCCVYLRCRVLLSCC